MINRIILILLIAVSVTSCVTRKEITYFQPGTEGSDLEKTEIQEKFVIKLQPGDILNIRVNSLSAEANQIFNIFPESQAPVQNQTNQTNMPAAAIGFMVDSEGNISLPLTGKIAVGNLSTAAAAAE